MVIKDGRSGPPTSPTARPTPACGQGRRRAVDHRRAGLELLADRGPRSGEEGHQARPPRRRRPRRPLRRADRLGLARRGATPTGQAPPSWVGADAAAELDDPPTSQHSASASTALLTAMADARTWPVPARAWQFGQPGGPLTRSPMTVYSKRACAPMWPAMARPAETRCRTRSSPRPHQFVVQLGGGQRRAGGVRMLDRGAEDAQRGVALELVDEAAVLAHRVDHHPEELVEQLDHLARADGWRRAGSSRPGRRTAPRRCASLTAEFGAPLQARRATSPPTYRPNRSRRRCRSDRSRTMSLNPACSSPAHWRRRSACGRCSCRAGPHRAPSAAGAAGRRWTWRPARCRSADDGAAMASSRDRGVQLVRGCPRAGRTCRPPPDSR